MGTFRRELTFLTLCILAGLTAGCSHHETQYNKPWNPKAAATYLDLREVWWMQWIPASRDHGTFCVSCHTAMPYALARPALRKILGEQAPTLNETRLLENVRARVRLGSQLGPYYTDSSDGDRKTAEALGTEAILNAFILADHDAAVGRLSADTRLAFANMWALQQKTGEAAGAWHWLRFGLEPWEANDSAYFGATLAAIAVGAAPENYASTPEIQKNMTLLRGYLNREYSEQSSINRVGLLWASAKLPGLISQQRKQEIINDVLRQQRSDGGWSLAKMSGTWGGWNLASLRRKLSRIVGTTFTAESDGYATGLITYSLQLAGVSPQNAQLKRGLSWLQSNQQAADGRWAPYVLNKPANAETVVGHFRSDAATSFAVLALTESEKSQPDRASVQ